MKAFQLKAFQLKAYQLALGITGVLIMGFFGGVYYQRQDNAELAQLNQTIETLEAELEQVQNRNAELEDIVALVKRQLQVDRTAYQSLLETVETSEQARQALQEEVQQQRQLLNKLKQQGE